MLQIVRSLGGTIDVQSELGVGTKVKVSLTLDQALTAPQSLAIGVKYENSVISVREKIRGLTLGLVGFHPPSSVPRTGASAFKVDPELPSSLQASLESMATVWFGMNVTTSESWEATPPDIYIADENIGLHSSFGGGPVIILCSNAHMYRAYARRTKQAT